jgi:N-acyl-D-amino-acid deacylase
MSNLLDYLIINVTIVDGNGGEPFEGSVGISNDRIDLVHPGLADLAAKQVIDAKGHYLTPGFIDTHASTGFGFFFPHP